MYEIFFNQRIKTYPNGMKIITTFNKTVFNPYHNPRPSGIDALGDRAPPSEHLPFDEEFVRLREDNLKRSIEKVFDIALMNNFDYFVTLTFDDSKVNSFDDREVNRVVKKWFNNMVNRHDLKYLCVPEYHKSGRIHLHALMSGNLDLVDSGTVLIPERDKPVKISYALKICKDRNKIRPVYNLQNWKNGFSTAIEFEKCDDKMNGTTAIAKYITKYMTKDLTKIMRNYYYAGGHLQRDVQTDYKIVNYDAVSAPEVQIENTDLTVKYITMGVV